MLISADVRKPCVYLQCGTTYTNHRIMKTMQSRRTFILIGTAVGAALVAAITLTMVWLVDSYRDRQQEFEDRINSVPAAGIRGQDKLRLR